MLEQRGQVFGIIGRLCVEHEILGDVLGPPKSIPAPKARSSFQAWGGGARVCSRC